MNSNQDSVNTIPASNKYDEEYVKLVHNVLNETVRSFEKEQKLSDKVLLNLYNIFGTVFERALELYEQGRITHIYSSETVAALPHNDNNNTRYLVQVKGFSGSIYVLFPDVNYCTCSSFRCQVLNDKSLFTCKHVLADCLATITKSKLSYQYMTETQFQSVLLHQVSYVQHVI
nr:zinc finger SWIM domain-containing protein 7-like [Megalopta genalis]